MNAIAAEGTGMESSRPRVHAAPGGPSMAARIVVINDYEDFLQIVEAVLSGAGYAVAAFSADETTVDDVRDARPDLLIVDLTAAESDGRAWDLTKLQAVEELRDAAVLLCSADVDRLEEWAGRWTGDTRIEVLPKPFTVDQLVGSVERLLDHGPAATA
jgi:DNA-binding NtrC family response regulator